MSVYSAQISPAIARRLIQRRAFRATSVLARSGGEGSASSVARVRPLVDVSVSSAASPTVSPLLNSSASTPRSDRAKDRQHRLRLLARARRIKGGKRGIDFRRFWVLLLRGRFEAAESMVDDLLRCYRPQFLYLRLFIPALSLSGTMFALGRITYHDEHRVTWGCLRLMRHVRSKLPKPDPTGLRAIATGVGQDSHLIGLRMVCDLMQCVGWQVTFLSTNERGTLRHALMRQPVNALLLSIGREDEFPHARRLIVEARRCGFTGVVAVGGRAVARDPNCVQSLGADLTAANGLELARKITVWSRARAGEAA